MSDLHLTGIDIIQNSLNIGSLNSILTNIDNNFQSILSNDYLRGKSGNNIEVKVLDFKDENSEESTGILKLENNDNDCYTYNELKIDIENAIKGSQISTHPSINDKQWNDNLKEFSITTIVEKNENEKYILKHSLYHIFSDARFENPSNNQDYTQLTNLSCIVYYNGTEWITKKMFPTIYYKEGKGFYWNINGIDTEISAQGPKGEPGEMLQPLVISNSTSISDDKYIISGIVTIDGVDSTDMGKYNNRPSLCLYSANGATAIIPCVLKYDNGRLYGISAGGDILSQLQTSSLEVLLKSNFNTTTSESTRLISNLFIPINKDKTYLHSIAANISDSAVQANDKNKNQHVAGNSYMMQPTLRIFPTNYRNESNNLLSDQAQKNNEIKLQVDYRDIELNGQITSTYGNSKIFIPVEENKLFSTNESNEITLIDNAMNSELNPNRLAFLNPDHIKIYRHNVEPVDNYSNWPILSPDEGEFWQDINQWDDIKKNSNGEELPDEEVTNKINRLKTSLVTQGLGTTNSIKLTTGRSPFPQIVSPKKSFDYDILKVEILTANYDEVDSNGNKNYPSFGELYGIVRKFHFLITKNHEIKILRSDGKTYANITGYVDIFEETIKDGEITKNKIETVKIYGWPGHSSTPMNFDFGENKGGSLNDRGTSSKLIFEFYLKNDDYSGGDEEVLIDHYTKNNKQWDSEGVGLEISGIRLFAKKFWANSTGIDLLTGNKKASPLASYGHLYGWDTEQNAIFPNSIIAIGDKNKIQNQISIKYQDLISLKTKSQLIPGVKYRINDYKDDDHPFDIIVEATEVNKLSEIAKAARSNNDNGYFEDCN